MTIRELKKRLRMLDCEIEMMEDERRGLKSQLWSRCKHKKVQTVVKYDEDDYGSRTVYAWRHVNEKCKSCGRRRYWIEEETGPNKYGYYSGRREYTVKEGSERIWDT